MRPLEELSNQVRPETLLGLGVALLVLALLASWGPCPAPPDKCPADLNLDGAVGITDLLILLASWGPQ